MSSPLSDAFRKAVENDKEKQEKRTKNRVEIAMENTEKRVAEKIQEIILREGLDFYYNGYSPKMYVRTDNLRRSGAISPYINEFKKNGMIGFQYGAEFDESLMDHSVLTIKVAYDRKRDGAHVEKIYSYDKEDVNEKAILDNFRAGVHPNTNVKQGPIWMKDMIGAAPDALRLWKDSGAIKAIFKEELDKLMK